MTGKNLTSDWTTGWYGSLSVKITSIVLWGIAIIGLSIAVVLLWNNEDKIRFKYNHNADTVALAASHTLFQSISDSDTVNWNILIEKARILNFTGFKIILDNTHSHQSGDTSSNNIVRKIYYYSDHQPKIATLFLYHLPFEQIQTYEQKKLLLTTVIICLVFGILLNWIIQKIIANPFDALLKAINNISEGQLDHRLNIERQDEFGQLALIFNKMMDQLSDQQNVLKETIKRAENATQATTTFVANMSHELRTPLNSIIGFTSIVKEGMAGDVNKEQIKQLTKAHNSAQHLLSLINELLDLTIIETGKTNLNINEFNITKLVTEVTDMLKPLCEKKSLRLQVECNNCGNIKSDEGKVRQILIILIDNAIKFTQSGSITVKSWGEEDRVWFEIIDTGSGIKEESLDLIFTAFYQEDSAEDRAFEGTGMGLALCKQYIHMLSSEISVVSTLNKGSCFTFYLTRAENNE
jgi:signal transduction histidine kinase